MLLFLCPAVCASVASPATAEEQPISIWYRSSDGCPSGDEFIRRLAELGRVARLAGAGDRIDFVVTLGAEQPTSAGRLERQTANGTVAIREVQAPSCQQVSQALALSLDLALGPRAAEAPSDVAPARDDAPPTPAPASGVDSAGEALPPAAAARPRPAPERLQSRPTPPEVKPAPTSSSARVPKLGFGLEATLATGIAPDPLGGVAALAQLGGSEYDSPSARLHLGVARSESDGLEFLLVTSRLEACVPVVGGKGFRAGPCASFELGGLRADYSAPQGTSDTGLWSSLGLELLAGLMVSSSFAVEAQLGGQVPLVRYETVGDDGRLFQTRSLGFFADLGLVWLPE